MKELKILYLYPDILDLYGDIGNIKVLKYRLEKRNIKPIVDTYSINDEKPDLYIVPSQVVADTIYKNHHEWLKTPGINGRQHKDNNIRNFSPDLMYLDAWDILR